MEVNECLAGAGTFLQIKLSFPYTQSLLYVWSINRLFYVCVPACALFKTPVFLIIAEDMWHWRTLRQTLFEPRGLADCRLQVPLYVSRRSSLSAVNRKQTAGLRGWWSWQGHRTLHPSLLYACTGVGQTTVAIACGAVCETNILLSHALHGDRQVNHKQRNTSQSTTYWRFHRSSPHCCCLNRCGS